MMKNEQNELPSYIRDLGRQPVMRDPKEIAKLIRQWREHGDRRAYDRLIYGNTRLIVSIARNYRGRGVAFADLVAEGYLGLMHAVKRFDPQRGVHLATYATYWIKMVMLRLIPSTTNKRAYSLPPKIQQRIGLVAKTINKFFEQYERPPTDKEVHKRIHALDGTTDETRDVKYMTLREVKLCRRLLAEKYPSLDAPIATGRNSNRDLFLSDVIPDPEMDVEEAADRQFSLSKIEAEASKLGPRERAILHSRFIEEATLDEIGKKYNLSRERIRQIEARALETIGRGLKTKK